MSSAPDVELNRPHSVYRCYASDDTLLYVGVAQDVEARMFHHLHLCNAGKQPNGTLRRHMARYEVENFATKLEARTAEREAISTEAPLLNRQHNPLRFRKVVGGRYVAVAPIHPLIADSLDVAGDRIMTTTLHAPCILPAVVGSACSHLAVTVGSHKAEVARIARLASKSEATYATYAGQLVKAKAELARTLDYLDLHMAECPGAVDRFGAS